MGQWEAGITKPRGGTLTAICEVLDISPTWLMTGAEDIVSVAPGKRDAFELMRSWYNELSNMEKPKRRGILAYLNAQFPG